MGRQFFISWTFVCVSASFFLGCSMGQKRSPFAHMARFSQFEKNAHHYREKNKNYLLSQKTRKPVMQKKKPTQKKPLQKRQVASIKSQRFTYRSIGGENLWDLARIFYSDVKKAKFLKYQNPHLGLARDLQRRQEVHLDLYRMRINSKLLTKQMLRRYSSFLASRVLDNLEGQLAKKKVVVQKGDTLQKISMRLFGTTRLWTEVYLMNKDQIKSFNEIEVGMELSYFERETPSPEETTNASKTLKKGQTSGLSAVILVPRFEFSRQIT